MSPAPHQINPATDVCVWCGFARFEIEDRSRLRRCPVPVKKRKTREIITIGVDGSTTIKIVPVSS